MEFLNIRCILSGVVTVCYRLIAVGRGQEAVQMIKQMSVERRNLRQQSLLHALAVLARCDHTETKEAAYNVLSDVCRIPTQLYLFVEYCEAVSRSSTGEISPIQCWLVSQNRSKVSSAVKNFKHLLEKLKSV